MITQTDPPRDAPTRDAGPVVRRADAVFKAMSGSAGLALLGIIIAIALFLVLQAADALSANSASFLPETKWFANDTPPRFGIAALVFGTVVTSVLALGLAVPVAIG